MSAAPEAGRGRVAVLGAGLAGLRAAHALRKQGRRVTVFEARAAVGGRVSGRWGKGLWMDSGWPVIGSRDASLSRWAIDLGLGDSMWPLRPVQTTLLRDGETHRVDGLSLAGASRIPGLGLLERIRLLRFGRLMGRYAPLLDESRPECAAALDYRSVRDHVELYFGKGALEFWLTPEVQSAFGDTVDELSRVVLLQHCQSIGVGARRPSLPGLPRRPLSELLEAVAEGLDVRLETAVERVDEEPSGGFRVETTNASGRREEAGFDGVVIALGPAQAARVCASLLTPAERDFFAANEEREWVSLSVAIEGADAGLPQEIRIPRREGSSIASLLVEPGQPGGRVGEGKTQIIVLARDAFAHRWADMANDVVAKNLLSSLELTLPGVGARLEETFLGRARAPFFGVGSYRRLEGFQKVQRDRRALGRRLYWAGDYLSGATLEAASLSGARAAAAFGADFEPGQAIPE